MLNSKLALHCVNNTNVICKRTLFSKIFGCGCFGKKGESESQPALTKDSKIVTKGMCMPVVGLGTWELPKADASGAINCAISRGYRHIDTALVYGNEKEIGDALTSLIRSGAITRQELFITSKLPFYAMSPDCVPTYLCKSLSNLGLGYVDLYLIHFPVGVTLTEKGHILNDHTNHIAIWRQMENLVHHGLAKNIGLSNFNICQVKNILECARILPANLQVEMHLYCQQKEILKFCKEHKIGVTAYAPLGSPNLGNFAKMLGLQTNGVPRPLENPSVKKIADWHKKCPSHILLRHLIQKGGTAVIPKSHCPENILKNFDLFDFCLEPCEMNEMNSMDFGEKGRMFSCNMWVGTEKHDEYPFK